MFRLAAFVVLFCQCWAAVPPPMKGFEEQKFSGIWIGKAAASTCPEFAQMKGKMTTPVIGFGQKNGQMTGFVSFQGQEGCQQMEMVMTTIEPGHYNYKSMHGDNEMVVGNTDYTIFAMEFTKTDHNGKSCVTLKLYGRSHDVPQEVLQQFVDHIGDMGMSKEKDLIVFNGEPTCLPKGQ